MDGTGSLEFRSSLKEVMEQLHPSWFVQCHKSYCVNLNYIDSTTHQTVTLVNGETIPIGRKNKEAFEGRLREFLRGSMA